MAFRKHGDHGAERDERMAELQDRFDAKGVPYTPELLQHLAEKQHRRITQ